MTSKTPVRVAEDVDESALSYAEIKALATGNPLIKEKMDLDVEVTKLKMLEANYKSNIYKLEDKIIKFYPKEIKRLEDNIENITRDIFLRESLNANSDNKFTSIEIKGVTYTDKKEGAERLLEEVKKAKFNDTIRLGKYRNFDIEVSYNSIMNVYNFTLKGNMEHTGSLGQDALGNITRMDNLLEKLEERKDSFIEKLAETKKQLETAKEELEKPFDKADILREKVLRLAEITKILDMGDVEENENTNPKIEEIKKAIIDFCNREYEENYSYDEFVEHFKDLEHIGIAYTETEDGKHSIQYELNLKDYSHSLFVDDKLVTTTSFVENENTEKALDTILSQMQYADFNSLLEVNENDLYKNLGLKINDEGNFYDPLEKDLDNDGISDRYDNDFRDSDYFKSTYDVDDNLQKKDDKHSEKPSTLGMIEKFKEQIKENIKNNTKDKEMER